MEIHTQKSSSTHQNKIHNVWHPIRMRRHTKNQKNITCNKEKNQSIETDTDVTQMLELVEEDNRTNINVLHVFQKIKEELNMLRRDVEYTLIYKIKDPNQTLVMKRKWIKNRLYEINRKLDPAKEKKIIVNLKTAVEAIQKLHKGKNECQSVEYALIRVPEREEGAQKIIFGDEFPKLKITTEVPTEVQQK